MRAAIDFGLTNIDIVEQDGDGPVQRFMLPCAAVHANAVDGDLVRRVLRETGHSLRDFERLIVTGGQHRRLPPQIDGIPVSGVDEVKAIGRGGLYLSGLPEALVVSAGSGTAMVAARSTARSAERTAAPDGGYHHATGSAVGGGTLQGLGRLLVGTSDAPEIDRLAAQGNANAVDLTLLEATGGILGRLPPDANAVNFGRVARVSARDAAWAPSREDVAAGLVRMIGQVIAVIAINAAHAEGLEHIVVVGHLVDLPSVRDVLSTVAGYYQASIRVPDTPGIATAVGALLMN
jgi:type II pantothenate kinase